MADEKKQPTKEEIEKKRAEVREAALKTFKGKLVDLATAFYVETSGQYGEAGANAVDEYIYAPAMKSDEYRNLMKASRQGGRRYSGSEWSVIESASKIVRQSLQSITAEDILSLMKSKVEVRDEFKEGFMGDYMQSESKEIKDFAKKAIDTYLKYLTDTKVAEALNKNAEAARGSLEDIVKKEEPKAA